MWPGRALGASGIGAASAVIGYHYLRKGPETDVQRDYTILNIVYRK